jgi:hypothetical protein
MRDFRQGRYLVQLTEHTTVEKEFYARDAAEAETLAASVLHAVGLQGFSHVERDVTDWTVCSLEPSQIGSANFIDAHRPAPQPAPSSLTADDVHLIAQLLDELRDTTLSGSTFDRVSRMLDLIRMPISLVPAQSHEVLVATKDLLHNPASRR